MSLERTFAGLPRCTDIETSRPQIAVVGIPEGTSYHPGEPSHSAGAPTAIRRAAVRYAGMLEHHDFDLGGTLLDGRGIEAVDCGDVAGDVSDSAANRERAENMIRSLLNRGAVPVVLGGDDSVPIAVFRAYRSHGPLTVVQVDAHIDWRDEVNGITEGPSSTMRRTSEMPWIGQMIQVGMRGVGSARPGELAAARNRGSKIFTADSVHAHGVEQILDLIPDGSGALMTIDCDALDPPVMPAVRAPLPGGLSYRQVVALVHGLAKKTRVRGFLLVEFVPGKDLGGLGALTASRIVFNMIGALARSKW